MRRYEWSNEELASRGLSAADLPPRLGRVLPARGGVSIELEEANESALLAWMPVSPRVVETVSVDSAATKWVEVPVVLVAEVEALVRGVALEPVAEVER